MLPSEIESKSFEIIERELSEMGVSLTEPERSVIIRVIHCTADFEHAHTLYFSQAFTDSFFKAVSEKALIVTDTNMAKSGITQKRLDILGLECKCFMADKDVAETALKNGTTRACAAVDKAVAEDRPVIFVSGNAPTFLIRLHEHIANGYYPAFVVAAPVGFVNVIDSKEMIRGDGVPQITVRGRKGGSNVAAAIVNAMLIKAIDAFHK